MPHTLLSIKNAIVKIAPTRATPVYVNFEDAVTSFKALFTSTDNTWEPVSGAIQNSTGALKHEIQLDLGQSTKNGELMQFLVANHGASGKIEIFPKGGTTTPKYAADLVIKAPGELGGGVGIATTSVAMKVDGQPTITWD
jgi:hypothetical protein